MFTFVDFRHFSCPHLRPCAYFYHRRIALHRHNFTLSYDTNIPRQVGLAGSSAIVTATVACLIKFYNLTEMVGFGQEFYL